MQIDTKPVSAAIRGQPPPLTFHLAAGNRLDGTVRRRVEPLLLVHSVLRPAGRFQPRHAATSAHEDER